MTLQMGFILHPSAFMLVGGARQSAANISVMG